MRIEKNGKGKKPTLFVTLTKWQKKFVGGDSNGGSDDGGGNEKNLKVTQVEIFCQFFLPLMTKWRKMMARRV